MLFVLILILALVFLPSPWSLVVIASPRCSRCALAVGVRYSRRGARSVGSQTMVGTLGEAISPLAPNGQVKVEGEIWEAHARRRRARPVDRFA